MFTQYHLAITRDALSEHFSPEALRTIQLANINQDSLSGQFGHPEFHFDDSAFEQGNRYIAYLREEVVNHLSTEDHLKSAWEAFGRLTHAAQDFYAHSNYINLWAESGYPGRDGNLTPDDILRPEILEDPRLISGKFYSPWEMITFLPWIGKKLSFLFPPDSHAKLNKDAPARSRLFPQVYQAAVYRTVFEYNEIKKILSKNELAHFSDDEIDSRKQD